MIQTDYKFGEVNFLTSQIDYDGVKPAFKNIFSNHNGGVVLLALKDGQELSTHTAAAEVMVNVLDGEIEFTMLGHPHVIHAGEFLLMGQDVPHSVVARTDSKIMLVKVKPDID